MNSRRYSNIELFRIVATIGVLIIHTTYFIFGYPTKEMVVGNPLQSFALFCGGTLSIGSVDMFVFISGWFGINPSKQSLFRFLFQCIFILLVGYILLCILGYSELNFSSLRNCLLLGKPFWFIKSYLLLYLLSPILNCFISTTTEKTFRNVVIGFFLFQTGIGWLLSATSDFNGGYSTISMIGLYLLARYFRLYPSSLSSMTIKKDLIVLVGIFILLLALDYASVYIWPPFIGYVNSYINPLIVLFALYAFLFFRKFRIESKFVNTIARSSFSVYLLQGVLIGIVPLWKDIVYGVSNAFVGITKLLAILIFIFCFFAVAIIFDQLRIVIYSLLSKCLCYEKE